MGYGRSGLEMGRRKGGAIERSGRKMGRGRKGGAMGSGLGLVNNCIDRFCYSPPRVPPRSRHSFHPVLRLVMH